MTITEHDPIEGAVKVGTSWYPTIDRDCGHTDTLAEPRGAPEEAMAVAAAAVDEPCRICVNLIRDLEHVANECRTHARP